MVKCCVLKRNTRIWRLKLEYVFEYEESDYGQ